MINVRVVTAMLLLLVLCNRSIAQSPSEVNSEITTERLLPIHLEAGREYALYADATRSKLLKLDEHPIFVWSNPRRSGGQAGHMFLWKDGERPLAVCTLFSFGWQQVPTNRRIVHEWHTLSETQLVAQRGGEVSKWNPKAGITFTPIPNIAGAHRSSARQRLELRNIAKQFAIHSIDPQGERWPLRVLTTPLAVYQTERGLGALIGWVGDAGSDPEFMMLLEPRESSDKLLWHYAPVRMTDHELYVELDKQPLWKSVRSEDDTIFHDKDNLYFRYPDKLVQLK